MYVLTIVQLTPGQDAQAATSEGTSSEESDRCKSAPTSPCEQGNQQLILTLGLFCGDFIEYIYVR